MFQQQVRLANALCCMQQASYKSSQIEMTSLALNVVMASVFAILGFQCF